MSMREVLEITEWWSFHSLEHFFSWLEVELNLWHLIIIIFFNFPIFSNFLFALLSDVRCGDVSAWCRRRQDNGHDDNDAVMFVYLWDTQRPAKNRQITNMNFPLFHLMNFPFESFLLFDSIFLLTFALFVFLLLCAISDLISYFK